MTSSTPKPANDQPVPSWKDARGILKDVRPGVPAEQHIREARDAMWGDEAVERTWQPQGIDIETNSEVPSTWIGYVDPGLYKASFELTVIHGNGLALFTLDTESEHIGVNMDREDVYRMCEQILEDRDRFMKATT